MSWILAKNLDRLKTNIKSVSAYAGMTIFAIGDAAHRLRVSGHNPDDTTGSLAEYSDADSTAEVRAVDLMKGSLPETAMVALRTALLDPRSRARLGYIIHHTSIWRRRNGWVREAYNGEAHDDHIHVSGWPTEDENGSDWPAVLELEETMRTLAYESFTGRLPILKYGDSDPIEGPDKTLWVKRAQLLLRWLTGRDIDIDGIYGDQTAGAVWELMNGTDGRTINLAVWTKLYALWNAEKVS